MKMAPPNLTVCLANNEVWIKIAGRANFTCSVDFRTVINKLHERGFKTFVLDLTECLLMDSTFLGVLAGLGLKFGQSGNGNVDSAIHLLNPNGRISDLLDNLGVAHLFTVRHGEPLKDDAQKCLEQPSGDTTRTELARTCLEAHETLMRINPANVSKFTDVAKFLAEDLRRLEDEEKGKQSSDPRT